MKIITILVGLAISTLSLCQIKSNSFDINYTLSYRDDIGFRWTSKLQGDMENLKMQGFNGGGFWQTKLGNSSLRLVYDMYQLPGKGDISTRFGFNFINSGPNTNINMSIFSNNGFGNFSGISGKIDINMKFK